MSSVTHAERINLADKAYTQQGKTKVEAPTGWTVVEKAENKSGLEIYAIQKVGTNEVVFATRGSDDGKDWGLTTGPNSQHSVGILNEQDQEALTFVDDFIHDHKDKKGIDEFHYSLAGDSKGGAITQILSHTFGLAGTTTDPAAGGGVVKSQEYLDFVKTLKSVNTPEGVPTGQLVNIREAGSIVAGGSAIWFGTEQLGDSCSWQLGSDHVK